MARRAGLAIASGALTIGLLGACSDGGSAELENDASSEPSVAESGGSLGAPESECELPVTFEIAERWEPASSSNAVVEPDDPLYSLVHQGPFRYTCEVDAKPAGSFGFLRVWKADPESAEQSTEELLRAFVEADDRSNDATYGRFTTAAGVTGSEVTYTSESSVLDEIKTERAFSVMTADGVLLIHLGGLDDEEHEEMRPAYELAKESLRLR